MATASKVVVTTQVTPPEGAQPGQLVVVGPDGTTLVTGDAYVIVEGSTGGSSAPSMTGGVDIVTNPVAPTLASGAAPGTQVATLTAPGITNPVYSGTSADGMLTVSGDKIVAGLVSADITLASSTSIKIRAQSADGKSAVEETLTIQFAALGAGAPAFDINLTNAISNGSASVNDLTVVQPVAKTAPNAAGVAQNFLANQLRRTNQGARIDSGAGARYVNKHSAEPAQFLQWDWFAPETVALPVEGIWHPIRVNHTQSGFGSSVYTEMTEPPEVGATYTVLFKTKPLADYPTAGMAIFVAQGGGIRQINQDSMVSGSPPNGTFNPDNITVNILRAGMVADGTYEMVVQVPCTHADLRIGMSGANNPATNNNAMPLAYYGIVITKGAGEQPAVATNTATVVIAGDVLTAGGAIATLLQGNAEGTIFLETYGIEKPTGGLMHYGATEVASFSGYTSVKGKAGAVTAVVGQGGMKGVCIIGIRKSGAGLDIVINGGDIASSAGAVNYAGALELLRGNSGWLRRITGYNTALSNADFQARSRIWNRALPNAPKATVIGQANMTFEETFAGTLAQTVATRADAANFDPTGAPDHVDRYVGRPGKLMPRYVHWTDPAGSNTMVYAYNPDFPNSGRNSVDQRINSEWQDYIDPQSPFWTGTGAAYGEAACPIQVGGGTGKLKAFASAAWPDVLAKLPNRRTNVNGVPQTDSGAKAPYFSGALTTAHCFEQKLGYFEARIKAPDGVGVWPAFWLLPGRSSGFSSPAEIDIMEGVGKVPGRTSSAIHANNYGLNDGTNIDMPFRFGDDFHTFGCEWKADGSCQFSIDGEKTVYKKFDISNINDHPMYILLNLAIGDSGSWQGVPDASTAAGAPYTMEVDYIRAFQYVS